MKILLQLFVSCLILLSTAFADWIPIDSVRVQDANGVPLLLNQTITTRGIVTTRREFGLFLVYFQSSTAGLVAFDTAFCSGVKRGDSIEVTGVVTQFSGLTELSPVTSFTILDTGRTVTPVVKTCSQIRLNGEPNEGMLIKIRNVTAVHTTAGTNATVWTVAGSGTNYRIFDGIDSCDIRIYATTNIANQPVHSFPFDVITECSQFKSSAPFNSGYQLLPRRLDDFSGATGINPVSNIIPDNYSLHQNYPNPFNPNTIINYEIPVNVKHETSNVRLTIYNSLGSEISTLVSEKQNAGSYSVRFDGANYPSGIYYYKLSISTSSGQTDNFTDVKKMILLK
ncbi:MAG: T9SS type A sorting domain-containing protein [bacterium]